MSKIEERVCKKIEERAKVGEDKYGVTMERGDLSKEQWLVHLQEELMDACVYIEKLLDDFQMRVSSLLLFQTVPLKKSMFYPYLIHLRSFRISIKP